MGSAMDVVDWELVCSAGLHVPLAATSYHISTMICNVHDMFSMETKKVHDVDNARRYPKVGRNKVLTLVSPARQDDCDDLCFFKGGLGPVAAEELRQIHSQASGSLTRLSLRFSRSLGMPRVSLRDE